MRILLVTTQKPDSTGSGVYLTQLARACVAAGHEVALVAGVALGDEPDVPRGVAFVPVGYETSALPFPVCGMSDVMPYPATRYNQLTPQMVQQLYAAFDAAIDTLLASGFLPDACICNHLYLLTAHLASREFAFPVYAICHGSDLRQFEKNPLEHDAIHAGLQRLKGVFALHEAQAKNMSTLHGLAPGRIHVVGSGYDSSVFYPHVEHGAPGSDAPSPSAAPRHRLIFVGKIARAKGVPSLLRALDMLPASPRLTLTLAGGAGSTKELAEAQKLAAASTHTVTFAGTLAPAELAASYNAADVFVLPSFYEGLPLTAIEALACGCKVVITELPGLPTWFSQFAPNAPIFYVAAPHMERVDVPTPSELPAFEQRLAAAIQEALESNTPAVSMEHLSWAALAGRVLQVIS